jgi:hypothetical protein
MISFFSRSEIQQWMVSTGLSLIGEFQKAAHHPNTDQFMTKRKEFFTRYSLLTNPTEEVSTISSSSFPSFLEKYRMVKVEDFQEELIIFPNNLQLINDQFLDITIFSGQTKFPELKKVLLVLKKYLKKKKQFELTNASSLLKTNLWSWFFQGGNLMRGRDGGGNGIGRRTAMFSFSYQWVLDLSLPLIQIFILSLFPWYRVERRVNPHP